MTETPERQPVVYLPHGGGPMTYVELGFPAAEIDALWAYWKQVGALPKTPPKAILSVSAHWETPVPTVMASPQPPMLYDYYGFPAAAYEIQWPAPGAPEVAERVRALLTAAGFETASDDQRGFDHGTFVPLGRSFPEAKIPTLQLSLKAGLNPAEHIAMGQALAPLRDEGVYIVGSGMSYHNMRGFRDPAANGDAERFDAWLKASVVLDEAERNERLAGWERAPSARAVHPREEHLLPLMVVSGAAGRDRGEVAFNRPVIGKVVSAVHFGVG